VYLAKTYTAIRAIAILYANVDLLHTQLLGTYGMMEHLLNRSSHLTEDP